MPGQHLTTLIWTIHGSEASAICTTAEASHAFAPDNDVCLANLATVKSDGVLMHYVDLRTWTSETVRLANGWAREHLVLRFADDPKPIVALDVGDPAAQIRMAVTVELHGDEFWAGCLARGLSRIHIAKLHNGSLPAFRTRYYLRGNNEGYDRGMRCNAVAESPTAVPLLFTRESLHYRAYQPFHSREDNRRNFGSNVGASWGVAGVLENAAIENDLFGPNGFDPTHGFDIHTVELSAETLAGVTPITPHTAIVAGVKATPTMGEIDTYLADISDHIGRSESIYPTHQVTALFHRIETLRNVLERCPGVSETGQLMMNALAASIGPACRQYPPLPDPCVTPGMFAMHEVPCALYECVVADTRATTLRNVTNSVEALLFAMAHIAAGTLTHLPHHPIAPLEYRAVAPPPLTERQQTYLRGGQSR